jgi:hypothetical protein
MRLFALAFALVAAMAVLLAPSPAMAAEDSEILLDVTGRIAPAMNAGGGARFDRQALEAMPQHRITTSTPWTDGVSVFEGPLLCDLLERVGADGTVVRARALNDYAVEIPISDCERYPVILALTRDGARLSRRDMGPIWVVYPRDEFPELQLETVNARWIWQLTEIEVR